MAQLDCVRGSLLELTCTTSGKKFPTLRLADASYLLRLISDGIQEAEIDDQGHR